MSTIQAVVIATTFVWMGMILAISFIEAPLKFTAPGITIPLGLGVGRVVFRALHAVTTVLALVVVVCLFVGVGSTAATVALAIAVGCLAGQLIFVQPRLTQRSNEVLAGGDHSTRSNTHHYYVAFECVKLIALLVGGCNLLLAAMP